MLKRLALIALLLLTGTEALVAQRPAASSAATSAAATTLLPPLSAAAFARIVGDLSEPGGFFDTDNLISNERSYLHVMGTLDRLGVRGGAYIGVGPDQSFSYIARTRSEIAFLLDIRRDNLLQHLLFKALFARSRTRAEYLALWLGRPVPPPDVRMVTRSIGELVSQLDAAPATLASRAWASDSILADVQRLGIALSATDLTTIARFHRDFMRDGLSLRFTSIGRPPRAYYPTLRDLLLETDRDGRLASYLSSEADFQYVKELQRRNLVIPVVGDLAGAKALRGIGRTVRAFGRTVSVLYVSNAEDYVMRDGGFAAYAASVQSLPRAPGGVMIRSWFGGPGTHPHEVQGYFSVQLLQTFAGFLDTARSGAMWSYGALVFSPHESP